MYVPEKHTRGMRVSKGNIHTSKLQACTHMFLGNIHASNLQVCMYAGETYRPSMYRVETYLPTWLHTYIDTGIHTYVCS